MKSDEGPRIELHPTHINARIEHMKTYALIEKFIGIWLIERALLNWIAIKWKPKSHFDLQLGSKGFFTIIFTQLDDRYKILEGGPYFFNFVGLYEKKWTKSFNPDK